MAHELLMSMGLPREVADRIHTEAKRAHFRETRVIPFEDVSEFAIGVRCNPLAYLDGKGIDIFSGMSHNTFIGFVYSKKCDLVTTAWGGIYEDVESDYVDHDDTPNNQTLTPEDRSYILQAMSDMWIHTALYDGAN
jgi:hypothetical protein